MSNFSRLLYLGFIAFLAWQYTSPLPAWWTRTATFASLFVIPGLLCWWPAVANLRAHPCKHRAGWLWILFMGPPCTLLATCYVEAHLMTSPESDQLLVWLGGLYFAGLSLLPYLLLACLLKGALIPAAAPSRITKP